MNEENIYKEGKNYVVRNEINGKLIEFGVFSNLDDAIELRDELEEYGWPYKEKSRKNEVEKYIFEENGRFIVSKFILDYEIIFGNFSSLKKAKTFKRKLLDNAWNLNFPNRPIKYAKYIRKENNRFAIVKNNNRFGSFENLDEAIMVRNELIDNNWGMGKDKLLHNLGINELSGMDHNLGKSGRYYVVYHWNNSICTFYSILQDHRLAIQLRDKLSLNWDNYDYELLDSHQSESDRKYIVEVNGKFRISKSINGVLKHFGHYDTLDEAIKIRNGLINNHWDDSFLDLPPKRSVKDVIHRHIHKSFRGFAVVNRIGGELINFGIFNTLDEAIEYRNFLEDNNWIVPEEEFLEEKYDEFIFFRNDDMYYLKKDVDGETKIFGVFDNPLDAIAARLDCMKNNWEYASISEEEYFNNDSEFVVGRLNHKNDFMNDLMEDNIYEEIIKNTISFPVTVGKSYKNKGWAIKRNHLDNFIPNIPYEKECYIMINGVDVLGSINIHTRLFYSTNKLLSDYLKKLYNIDPKIQTRVDFDVTHGNYQFNSKNNFLKFRTKFSKSFKNGLFAIPRSVSKEIIPILPYENECNFIINGIEVKGRFNLEFRFKFTDDSIINELESYVSEGQDVDIVLLL